MLPGGWPAKAMATGVKNADEDPASPIIADAGKDGARKKDGAPAFALELKVVCEGTSAIITCGAGPPAGGGGCGKVCWDREAGMGIIEDACNRVTTRSMRVGSTGTAFFLTTSIKAWM